MPNPIRVTLDFYKVGTEPQAWRDGRTCAAVIETSIGPHLVSDSYLTKGRPGWSFMTTHVAAMPDLTQFKEKTQ